MKYVFDTRSYGDVLRELSGELGSIAVMEPAEYELRQNLQPLLADGVITPSRNPFWLTENDDFIRVPGESIVSGVWIASIGTCANNTKSCSTPTVSRSAASGAMTLIIEDMERAARRTMRPSFELTDVTREVCELIDLEFCDHPGCLDRYALPSTREHADALWSWACAHWRTFFGPYEDAMSTKDVFLFIPTSPVS